MPAPGARAAIDLGSNSALLLIRDPHGRVLVDEATVVGLGRGLGDGGTLQPDRVDAALATLARYASLARAHGVPPSRIAAQTTSAVRRARDATAFLRRVQQETGILLRLIDGVTEARRNRLGALSDPSILPSDAERVAVVDIGGGSTEVSDGAREISLEIGSVRLVEAHLPFDLLWTPHAESAMRDAITTACAPLASWSPCDALVVIAGTATTLATRDLGLTAWHPQRVHGHRLSREALSVLAARWRGSDEPTRRADLPADPDRAGPVPGGLLLLDGLLDHLGQDEAIVSIRDARWWLTDPDRGLGPDGSRE